MVHYNVGTLEENVIFAIRNGYNIKMICYIFGISYSVWRKLLENNLDLKKEWQDQKQYIKSLKHKKESHKRRPVAP